MKVLLLNGVIGKAIENYPIEFLVLLLLFFGFTITGYWAKLVQFAADIAGAIGEMGFNILDLAKNLVKSLTDYLEALRYIVFGNFNPVIRFAVANYTILFASIAMICLIYQGLTFILPWELALALALSIQTGVILTTFHLAQRLGGEYLRWKRITRYYATRPSNREPNLQNIKAEGTSKKPSIKNIIGYYSKTILYLVAAVVFILLSSALTYITTYQRVLEGHIMTSEAYRMVSEMREDMLESRKEIDAYLNASKRIFLDFFQQVQEINALDDNMYALERWFREDSEPQPNIDDGASEKEMLLGFEAYLMENAGVLQENQILASGNTIAHKTEKLWNGEYLGEQSILLFQLDMVEMVRNAIYLKRYQNSLINESFEIEAELKDKTDELSWRKLEDEIDALRTLIYTAEQNNSEAQRQEEISEQMRSLVEYAGKLYRQYPELSDIKVLVEQGSAEQDRTEEGTAALDEETWKMSFDATFPEKYNDYLKLTDSHLWLPSRAFQAILSKRMSSILSAAACLVVNLLIVICCFIRNNGEPGESVALKQNTIRSIFVKKQPEIRRENMFFGTVLLCMIGWFLVYLAVGRECISFFWAICIISVVAVILILNFQKIKKAIILYKEKFVSLMKGRKREEGTQIEQGASEADTGGKGIYLLIHLLNDGDELFRRLMTSKGMEILQSAYIKHLWRDVAYICLEESNSYNRYGKNLPFWYQKVWEEYPLQLSWRNECCIPCTGESGRIEPELIALCKLDLVIPIQDSKNQIQGFVLTKECIRLLLRELFHKARREGLDGKTFKEDLKEYEEDSID